ncbi:hypothetical protein [Flavobacterium sp. W21_SRS_FM6]|uniref:hypothetical protein n=1 Tax=Flavobacterium sp. W21_SRS_FM6 TaxID=3240268 RepID=UPI003F93B561
MWQKFIKNQQIIVSIAELMASFVTIIGIIGIYFVYQQLKMNEDEIALNTVGQVYSQMVDIDKEFMNHPDARLYIYGNLRPEDVYPDATPHELRMHQSRAEASAEMMMDFFSQLTLVQDKLGPAAQNWVDFIKDIYKCSPVVRERYARKEAWYKDENAATIINQAKAEISEGGYTCDAMVIPKT